jgi:hypothetical protein
MTKRIAVLVLFIIYMLNVSGLHSSAQNPISYLMEHGEATCKTISGQISFVYNGSIIYAKISNVTYIPVYSVVNNTILNKELYTLLDFCVRNITPNQRSKPPLGKLVGVAASAVVVVLSTVIYMVHRKSRLKGGRHGFPQRQTLQ